MFLEAHKFDKQYFNGKDCEYAHNAGYSDYDRMQPRLEQQAEDLIRQFDLRDKTVLELGCAKGYTLAEMQNRGVTCYGVDISKYATSCVDKAFSSYVETSCAIEYLKGGHKADFIFSLGFLECLTEEEVVRIVGLINNNAGEQYHTINLELNERFYLRKPREWWEGLDWKNTTLKFEHISQSVKVD